MSPASSHTSREEAIKKPVVVWVGESPRDMTTTNKEFECSQVVSFIVNKQILSLKQDARCQYKHIVSVSVTRHLVTV